MWISGLPFTFTKAGELMTLMTTGEIGSSVAWAVDENGTPLVPPATGTALNVIEWVNWKTSVNDTDLCSLFQLHLCDTHMTYFWKLYIKIFLHNSIPPM